MFPRLSVYSPAALRMNFNCNLRHKECVRILWTEMQSWGLRLCTKNNLQHGFSTGTKKIAALDVTKQLALCCPLLANGGKTLK